MLSQKKHRGSLGRNLATLLILGILAAAAGADDWPQWLGPRRDGIWRESGILEKFPKGGPAIRWRAPIAAGYAGPAVADGKVYVTDRAGAVPKGKKLSDGKERILCLEENTGQILWKHEYEC